MDEVSYRFVYANECNMCNAPISEERVIGRRLSARQRLRPSRRVGISVSVVRCESCGLVFAHPMPLPLDLGQHYEIDPREYWGTEPPGSEDHWSSGTHMAEEIATFRRLWSSARDTPTALDVGAGLGHGMISLAKAGFDVQGLEPSDSFRRFAVERTGVPADRLVSATLETAEFPERSFDLVTFGGVLEHVADPAGALARAADWVAPGGLVHVEVPSARWLVARMLNAAYRVQGLDWVTNVSPMHAPYHLYEFTIDGFRAAAARSSFEVAWHRHVVCTTYMPRLLDPLMRAVMRATGTGLQLEVWLRRP